MSYNTSRGSSDALLMAKETQLFVAGFDQCGTSSGHVPEAAG